MSKQKIYLLLGQKGSGKSFIGAIMEKRFGITFIRVEDWAKQIKKDRAVDDEVYLKEGHWVAHPRKCWVNAWLSMKVRAPSLVL